MVLDVAESDPCGGVANVPGRFGPVGVVCAGFSDSDPSRLSELAVNSFSLSSVRIP